MKFSIAVKTTNPNNGATGNSKLAGIIKSRIRKTQRKQAEFHTRAALGLNPQLPVLVTLTRVAPSSGLDTHDGLGASLKGIIDGITDALGLPSDRDSRVRWHLTQRRGRPKEYAVEIWVRSMADAAESDSGGILA